MTDRYHDFTLFRHPTDSNLFFFEHVTHFNSGSVSGALVSKGVDEYFESANEAIAAMRQIVETDDSDDQFAFHVIDDEESVTVDYDNQFVANYRSGFFKA